jgi:hypothetical protein
MMALDLKDFVRLGMPPTQAATLVEMIENCSRAPDIFTLNVKTGMNLNLAHELCEQIVGGMGRAAPLVQWGMDLELAEAVAGAISAHSPWRPHGLARDTGQPR